MGLSPLGCSCEPCKIEKISIADDGKIWAQTKNPNPDPKNFEILEIYAFRNAHVLVVKYPNCTNFEGKKVLVYKGKYKELTERDPHFSKGYSPIARFAPTREGQKLAIKLAEMI